MNAYTIHLERIMKRAVGSGLTVAGIILISGVLFGWAYALMLGLIIIFLVTITGGRK
jgi:hypothetical protein